MLYSSEFDNIISKDISTLNKYLGCYASIEIPIFRDKSFAIINIDPAHKIGSHWTVLYKGEDNFYEFFDPLGNSPAYYEFKKIPDFVKLKYNSKKFKTLLKTHVDTTVYITCFLKIVDICWKIFLENVQLIPVIGI